MRPEENYNNDEEGEWVEEGRGGEKEIRWDIKKTDNDDDDIRHT